MTHSEAGKGDTQRPTNTENFNKGYDTIDWSAKEVTCPNCGEKFMLSSKYPHTHVCKEKEKLLTQEAQAERDDFEDRYGEDGNCSCFISPPCNSCTHPGNPLNQNEDDTAWEYVGSN